MADAFGRFNLSRGMSVITRMTIDPEKLIAAMLYIAKSVDVDKYRMSKLLFLSDYAHLARYGRPIVGGKYCAMANGPVPSEALNVMNFLIGGRQDCDIDLWSEKELQESFEIVPARYPLIKPRKEADFEVLSASDVEILNEVVRKFGTMSFEQLFNLTHEMPAYVRASERNPDSNSAHMAYEDFFDGNEFEIPGVREEFLENVSLTRLFPSRAF